MSLAEDAPYDPLSEPEIETKKRKPVQAFGAPKTKRVKSLIKENATKSPLMSLPREIRDKIWKNLLADLTIHIEADDAYSTSHRHVVCQATVSPSEQAELSKSQKYHEAEGGVDTEKIHAECHRILKLEAEDRKPYQINLSILRVCRQAYVETNPILWNTTTWSFSESLSGQSISSFCNHRNALQRREMRKLDLSSHIWGLENIQISEAIVKKFKSLDTLYVRVKDSRYDQTIKHFFNAKNIIVYCDGDFRNEQTTWEAKVKKAEDVHSVLKAMPEKMEQTRSDRQVKRLRRKEILARTQLRKEGKLYDKDRKVVEEEMNARVKLLIGEELFSRWQVGREQDRMWEPGRWRQDKGKENGGETQVGDEQDAMVEKKE